jgi:hypothetical protein
MPTNIAVLIDAENIDPTYAEQVFSYANTLGNVTVREIFGAAIALNEWVEPIMEYVINPHITLKPNRYKNSSDISLVLGAAEVIINNIKHPETACGTVIIVSSDCDFSPVAARLRGEGLKVIGMGEDGHVNPVWPKACSEYIQMEQKGPLMRKRAESEPSTVVQLELVEKSTETVEESPEPIEEEPTPVPSIPTEVYHRQAPRIAPTHQLRVEKIRDFIKGKIDDHGGRIKFAELLKELSFLADYRFDHRRSNRTPIEYLRSFYSSWFDIEDGERGSYWISVYDPLKPVRVWHSEPEPTVSESVSRSVDEGQGPETPAQPEVDEVSPEPVSQPVVDEQPSDHLTASAEEVQIEGEEQSEEALEDTLSFGSSTPIAKAGLPRKTVMDLRELGFNIVEDFLNTSIEDLAKMNSLPGNKRKRLLKLQNSLRERFAETELPADFIAALTDEEEIDSDFTGGIEVESESTVESTEGSETANEPAEESGIAIEIKEVTPSRLPPLDSLLEKAGVPHRAAMTLRKFGIRTIGGYLNLTDEQVSRFAGVSTQRRERILQLRDELKEKYDTALTPEEAVPADVDEDQKPSSEDTVSEPIISDTEEGGDEPSSSLFDFLSAHKVPLDHISRILFIVGSSSNGRIVYNELRKEFGTNTANEYQRLLREYRQQRAS